METLPTIIKRTPKEVVIEAQEAATTLLTVIQKKPKPVIIRGEQYLEYEDWQLISEFDGRGYTVKTRDATPVEVNGIKGAKAVADLYDKEGRVIGGAEAYCMEDEENWGSKPWYQLASMAQTRAGAKAFRNKFSFVAMLGGFKSTPAEEMQGAFNGKKSEPQPQAEKDSDFTPKIIKDVMVKHGKTNNKDWSLYTIIDTSDVRYITFDEKIALLAKQLKAKHAPCVIVFEETAKGNKVKELQEYTENEPEENEDADHTV